MTSASRQSKFWRADWFAVLLVVLAVSAIHAATDWTGALERSLYDFASIHNAPPPSNQIAVIAIDQASIAAIGHWPWSRDIHARLIDKLAAAKVKTIVDTVDFYEAEPDAALSFIRQMQDVLAASGEAPTKTHEQLAQLMSSATVALDTDSQLASSLSRAGNVIIASRFRPGQQPADRLALAATGLASLSPLPDSDGLVRQESLLTEIEGKTVPSMALLAVARNLDLSAADIERKGDHAVKLGRLRIKTDGAVRVLPQFYPMNEGQSAFALDSFNDVLTGAIPASRYANKLVVIGITATGLDTRYAAPGNPSLSRAELVAHIAASLMGEHYFVQPAWGIGVELGTLALVCGYLMVAVPRLAGHMAVLLTSGIMGAMLGAEYTWLLAGGLWIKLVFPAAVLLIGHLALAGKHFWRAETAMLHSEKEPSEINRMMGLALQGQGQLDLAFERFCCAPMGDSLMKNLLSLAHEYEKKGLYHRAEGVYQHMAGNKQDGKGLQSQLTIPANSTEQPMLGRYQLERELGKGAMGIVYLGKDPQIDRLVAIKTMALSEEFEGKDLLDARERFFREAATAGRLQHQNIVTIFDAGEDRNLAFIAMEYLKGQDLLDFCKPGHLLPVPTVLSIVARVADALGYAHCQNVVHRDIKPANIMYEVVSDSVKVTDFGIARITDSSKTRTGLVLGTPSFMSPEQLAGKKVDGRSDLYSLGVTLYQMLTGELPFRADSMAELMRKITSDSAVDIRTIRPELPHTLTNLVASLLRKQADERYQDGGQLAGDLRAVLSGCNTLDLEI